MIHRYPHTLDRFFEIVATMPKPVLEYRMQYETIVVRARNKNGICLYTFTTDVKVDSTKKQMDVLIDQQINQGIKHD